MSGAFAFEGLVLLLAAPFIGSFLSVLAVRLPAHEDVVSTRSRCMSCSRVLGPLELFPVASWALQRGRCAGCGAAISALYPVVEIGAVIVAAWALLTVPAGVALWATVLLGWTLLALAAMDVRSFVLSDLLTLPLVLAGLGVAWWIEADVAMHALGAGLGFLVMVGAAWAYKRLRGREGLGFGDAKLMAAAGAWTGVEGVGTVLLYGSAICIAAILALRVAGRPIDAAAPVPFGAGLAAGIWLTWLYGPLLTGAAHA